MSYHGEEKLCLFDNHTLLFFADQLMCTDNEAPSDEPISGTIWWKCRSLQKASVSHHYYYLLRVLPRTLYERVEPPGLHYIYHKAFLWGPSYTRTQWCQESPGLLASSGLQVALFRLAKWCVIPIGIQPELGYPTSGIVTHPQPAFRITVRVGKIKLWDYLNHLN